MKRHRLPGVVLLLAIWVVLLAGCTGPGSSGPGSAQPASAPPASAAPSAPSGGYSY